MPGEGSGHVYMYTDYIPCQEKEAVMYTCIRIIGTDIDYIPCQEKEAVMYTCIRITYHARRRKRHVYMYTDYIPCQEKEAVMYTCIRIIGTDIDFIPCQEKEAVMYTCIRITYHARRRKRSCIHVYGL